MAFCSFGTRPIFLIVIWAIGNKLWRILKMRLKMSANAGHFFQASISQCATLVVQDAVRCHRPFWVVWSHAKYCTKPFINRSTNITCQCCGQYCASWWPSNIHTSLSLYSLSNRTSYCQISRSIEAARLGVMMIVSLRHLTGIAAVVLPRCLSNFRAIRKV